MNHETATRRILADLHSGRASRNRDIARFGSGSGRGVHALYRRLRSLLLEISRPGRESWLEGTIGTDARVVVRIAGLRYRRTVPLDAWEADFLLSDMGAGHYLSDRRVGTG